MLGWTEYLMIGGLGLLVVYGSPTIAKALFKNFGKVIKEGKTGLEDIKETIKYDPKKNKTKSKSKSSN